MLTQDNTAKNTSQSVNVAQAVYFVYKLARPKININLLCYYL